MLSVMSLVEPVDRECEDLGDCEGKNGSIAFGRDLFLMENCFKR